MPFEPTRLERFRDRPAESVFTEIYNKNEWGSTESVSGKGSDIVTTNIIINTLPEVFKKYNIKRLYDGACGDFNWMRMISHHLEYYEGSDIVKTLIQENIRKYFINGKIEFNNKNLIENSISGQFDAILLRDVLVHLPNESIKIILDKIKTSNIKYIIATNFKESANEYNIDAFGLWRPVNLEIEPFGLGEPLESIHESNQTYKINEIEHVDKYLNIWEINKNNDLQ